MYYCTYARARARVYVPSTVAAACCMLHTSMQTYRAAVADGRKPHTAAVVVTSYRSYSCVTATCCWYA